MSATPLPISPPEGVDLERLIAGLQERFRCTISVADNGAIGSVAFDDLPLLPALCRYLFWGAGCRFGGIVVEERADHWELRYLFLAAYRGWIEVLVKLPLATASVPSISADVHGADWHEREAEDLFGMQFEKHPRLGDFVLHDQIWGEGLTPFRKQFDITQVHVNGQHKVDWRPLLVVRDPGAFAMPVGPVYEGGIGESIHFMLETVGEDVLRAVPRLFFNFRAVEKIAEGKTVNETLLLAERFAAKSSFAHSLAFCSAVERLSGSEVPLRAKQLRIVLCELERLRHHTGAITGICESTALAVSAAHAAIIEEQLLRSSCRFACHRYLFGLNTPGGLRRDFTEVQCGDLLLAVDQAAGQLKILEDRLSFTSSFLDRLEEAGIVDPESARDLNLLGPVGRASGRGHDLRKECPYGVYEQYEFAVPRENQGDGYARLRIFFQEAYQSARLIRQVISSMAGGSICGPCILSGAGAALGWSEAPIGATLHWVRLDGRGLVERYRIITPSFNNWMGFHVAVENFAFQDFPIILATFGLSATECDR
jgi:Ni,Fe-hydrogenase III large subunit/Ni,Fe-hydrogenase III component G